MGNTYDTKEKGTNAVERTPDDETLDDITGDEPAETTPATEPAADHADNNTNTDTTESTTTTTSQTTDEHTDDDRDRTYVDIPDKMYHAVHREKLDGIESDGLHPSDARENDADGVYVATSFDDAVEWAEFFGNESTGLQDDYVIVEVERDNIPSNAQLREDENIGDSPSENEPSEGFILETDDNVPVTRLAGASEQAAHFLENYENRDIDDDVEVFDIELENDPRTA